MLPLAASLGGPTDVKARRLLSEAEHWNSPWIQELEKVLNQSVEESDRHPEQGFSNVSFSCLLDHKDEFSKIQVFFHEDWTKHASFFLDDVSAGSWALSFLDPWV